jgi:hypothetical protein
MVAVLRVEDDECMASPILACGRRCNDLVHPSEFVEPLIPEHLTSSIAGQVADEDHPSTELHAIVQSAFIFIRALAIALLRRCLSAFP